MTLRCGLLLMQWHTPKTPRFHPNLFVIPREFSVQNTVELLHENHVKRCWKLLNYSHQNRVKILKKIFSSELPSRNIIKRIEVRTRLAVFTNRQCERDNRRLSVNSLAVIQIIRQAGVLLSKQWLVVNENPSCADQQKCLLVVTTGRGQGLKFFRRSHFYSFDNNAGETIKLASVAGNKAIQTWLKICRAMAAES